MKKKTIGYKQRIYSGEMKLDLKDKQITSLTFQFRRPIDLETNRLYSIGLFIHPNQWWQLWKHHIARAFVELVKGEVKTKENL